MKRIFIFSLCILFVLVLPFSLSAHSGGTDEHGGHYDKETGKYHYHHGYPAHQHVGEKCPYDNGTAANTPSGVQEEPSKTTTVKEKDKSLFEEFIIAGASGAIIAWIYSRIKRKRTPKQAFLKLCEKIINEYEQPLSIGVSSCSSTLVSIIEKKIEKADDADFGDTERQSRTLLVNITFSLLTSGTYHIHAGTLNPMGEAPAIRKVFECSLKWLLDNNALSKEGYITKQKELSDGIASAG